MAKTQITHACGCTVTHNITGKVSGRDAKAEWLASRVCRDCWVANERASVPAHIGAELTGSDKQVAWANDIRAKAQTEFDAARQKVENAPGISNVDKAKIIAGIDAIANETIAKAWIDKRHALTVGNIVKQAAGY